MDSVHATRGRSRSAAQIVSGKENLSAKNRWDSIIIAVIILYFIYDASTKKSS